MEIKWHLVFIEDLGEQSEVKTVELRCVPDGEGGLVFHWGRQPQPRRWRFDEPITPLFRETVSPLVPIVYQLTDGHAVPIGIVFQGKLLLPV